jgi:hypothetical protein
MRVARNFKDRRGKEKSSFYNIKIGIAEKKLFYNCTSKKLGLALR